MNINERIAEWIKTTGLTLSEVNRRVGLSNGMMNKVAKGENSLSIHNAEKIFMAFPDLNPLWIFTGQGSQSLSGENDAPTWSDPASRNNAYYLPNASVSAGAGSLVESSQSKIPVSLPWLRGNGFLLVHVRGTSMWPTLLDGDVVALREIFSLNDLTSGKIYAVVKEGEGWVKRVYKPDNGEPHLEMTSDNVGFPSFRLELEEGITIYEVMAGFSSDLSKPDFTDSPAIRELARRLKVIEEQGRN